MIPVGLPWGLTLRCGGSAVIALALVGAGWKCAADRSATELQASAHALMVCTMDRGVLAESLHEVNAKAEQAKRDAAAQAVYAVEAVRQADRDRAAYERDLAGIEGELAKAKRAPTCKAQLESELCVQLR